MCDGSPKVSNFSPLISPTTIKVLREPNSIDVVATFGVSLTIVGDLHKLINDIEAGKYDELLSEMTNDDRMKTMDALCTICNSIQDNSNADVTTGKVLHVDDSINLNVDESIIPSDPIVQSVNINIKSTSYVGATGASAKDQPKVNSNFRTLVADPVFDGVNISIPRKIVEKADLVDVVTIGIPSLYGDGFTKETTSLNEGSPDVIYTNNGFQTVGKKKKRKCKSKSTNGDQFVGPSVKQNVRYEPKVNTRAPKKGVTNVGNTSQSSSMLKMTSKSSKKDSLSMSNSFSALNDEEDVKNVYDESANLIQNTKAGGSSYFTAAAMCQYQQMKNLSKKEKGLSTTPTTCIVTRETLMETQSKRKEKVDAARGKGIDLLSEVALTEEAQMKEVRKKSLRDFHKSEDDINNEEGSEQENDSEEHESEFEQDTDGSESDSESDQQDDDDDNDDDKSEGDKDKGMDSDDVQDKNADLRDSDVILSEMFNYGFY
nr:hypothetical protein [Tanacetum cinerariifolium]